METESSDAAVYRGESDSDFVSVELKPEIAPKLTRKAASAAEIS